ncbi:hypothetical protein COCON_G00223620 [Conger conger]|uniref:Myb/SANT-like DNA-binding domain-containing protein n=1 Tax=Conger conger TaxID=82655 RepID=A0A9Q1HL31_CONCO|nr:myb-related transcription factor, partner of profilin-like [Conger conger]KAJ8250440.1 hypothetical protein COCON_G00223620 [Conger conger]
MSLHRERLRKHKFTDAELDILLEEVTRHEDALFGLQGNCLATREKYKIWFEITERVCSASGIQRSINDVKRRWQDLKRRTKAKVVDARRHVPRDSSPSPLNQLPDERKVFDSFSIHTVIKDEEQNSTACNLPEDLFLDTDSVSPETSLPSVEPEQTQLKDQPYEETPPVSVLPVPHTEINVCSSTPVSIPHPNVSIKAEVHRRCLIGSRSENLHKDDSHTSSRVVTSCPGLRVPVRAQAVPCPRRPAALGSFEQQLLRAHREHTAALREGFRSLTRQNRLLYREMCETNKNVARIASRLAEKNDSVSDVAEELMGIQHKITESIDATNCLQDRVIDLMASYQERPLIVMPSGRRDGRPVEEDNSRVQS